MSGNEHNSNYTMDALQLISKTGKMVDLKPYFTLLEIYEDIHSPFLSGELRVVETESIGELLPLVGDEFVFCSLRMHGPHNATPRYVHFFMDIYTVEDEERYKHNAMSFTMQLISRSFKKNADKRTRKFYRGRQHEIVAKIWEEQIGEKLERNLDFCEFEEDYIFPNWHPVGCITKLAQNSKSVRYQDSDYVFYEDLNGFHYLSISYMNDPANGEVLPSTAPTFKNSIVDKTNTEVTDYNINKYNRKTTFNIIENMNRGMLGTTLIYHDIVNRKWRESGDNYLTTYPFAKHNAPIPLTLFANKDNEKNKVMLLPMNGILNPGVYTDEFYQDQKKRLAIRQMQSEQNSFVIEFNGEPNMEIGKPMKFDIQSMKVPDIDTPHEKLNGYFLIQKIRHSFTRKEYTQYVEITKDSYEK